MTFHGFKYGVVLSVDMVEFKELQGLKFELQIIKNWR